MVEGSPAIWIDKYKFNVQDNYFDENYSGGKGTALYIKHYSSVKISNNIFANNGPVYALAESFYSPYVRFYSGKPITFYDDECTDEFTYLKSCNDESSPTLGLQWSRVKGAVHVIFCETGACQNLNVMQRLEIIGTDFTKNYAGPILDIQSKNTASQLFVTGGKDIQIINSRFFDNKGTRLAFPNLEPAPVLSRMNLANFFPPGYFDASHSPLIRIMMTPSPKIINRTYLNVTITNSKFFRNKNVQVYGVSSSLTYPASLIHVQNLGNLENYQIVIVQLIIEGCDIRDNQFIGMDAQLIYSENVLTKVYRSNFLNNGRITQTLQEYGTENQYKYVDSIVFNFKSYTFMDSQEHGCLTLYGSVGNFPAHVTHEILNNTFKYNFAQEGTAYRFIGMENQQILISGNKYCFMFASSQGQIMQWTSTLKQSTILLQRENAQFMFGKIQGAIVVNPSENNIVHLIVLDSVYNHVYAEDGQTLAITQNGKLIIRQVNFTREEAINDLRQFIISNFNPTSPLKLIGDFIAEDTLRLLTNDLNQYGGQIYLESVENSVLKQPVTFNGQVFSDSTMDPYFQHAEIINCNFRNLYSSQHAALSASWSQVRIINEGPSKGSQYSQGLPKFQNNLVTISGIIGVDKQTQFSFENLIFVNNTSLDKASALQLGNEASGVISNSIFLSNKAVFGTVVIESGSKVEFNNCTFSNNYARDASVFYMQHNNEKDKYSVKVQMSKFLNNTSETNLANIMYSTVEIMDSIFLNNVAASVNHGFSLMSSNISITNSTINYTQVDFLERNSYQVDTGFFNLNQKSTLYLRNTKVENCRGAMVSFIYSTGRSQVWMGNGTIIKNAHSLTGDAIIMTMSLNLVIDNVTFQSNGQRHLSVDETPLTITNSKFNGSVLNAMKVTSSYVRIINNTFEDWSQDFSVDQGKAINCDCYNDTLIQNNSFKGHRALQGGVMYLQVSKRVPGASYRIFGNRFFNNIAQQGGAIFIESSVAILMKDNVFLQNKAILINPPTINSQLLSPKKGLGGAIYFACQTTKGAACNLTLENRNQFISNSAENDGGAIIWVKEEPKINKFSTFFSNNSADYGNDIASFVKSYAIRLGADDSGEWNSSRILLESQQSEGFPTLVSGGTLDFNVYLLDQNGLLYTTDSQSKLTVGVQDHQSDVLLRNNEAIAQDGVYKVRGFKVIAKPGTNPQLQLSFDGVETFGNSVDFLSRPINITVNLRKCMQGEEYTVDQRCVPCLYQSYLFEAPEKPTPCKECPENSICYGEAAIAPVKGHWRSSNTSINIIKCPNVEACLGGNQSSLLGTCLKGYQGIVCGDCEPGYSKVEQFVCSLCPEYIRNMIQAIIVMVGALIYVVFLVRSSLNSATERKSAYSVYLKIMTNHFQILSAISNIDYQWPRQIEDFQNQQTQVASVSESIFSFDCFMMGSDTSEDSIPVFFKNLMVSGFLPFLLTLLSFLFWSIVGCVRQQSFTQFIGKFVSTLIIVLFLVHPNIAKQMFLAFDCIKIDGVQRMKENVSTVCYQGTHLTFTSIVAYPSIGLWVFGIPLLAFIVLYRNKRILNLMLQKKITKREAEQILQLKTKYGFLFSGYDVKTYYWEVIIMLRKILIIMASVFLSTISPESQILVALFIIVLSMFLHIKFDPYQSVTLNKMENYSLLVAAVTIYTGMFYVTGAHYDYMNDQGVSWFFLVCIVLPNVVFITYWLVNMRIEILKVLYKRNLRATMFTLIACSRPAAFYQKYIKPEEEAEAENEQIIIDTQEFSDIIVKGEEKGDVTWAKDACLDLTQNNKSFSSHMTIEKEDNLEKEGEERAWTPLQSARSSKVHPAEYIYSDRSHYEKSKQDLPGENLDFNLIFDEDYYQKRIDMGQNSSRRNDKLIKRYGLQEEYFSPSNKKGQQLHKMKKKKGKSKGSLRRLAREQLQAMENIIERDRRLAREQLQAMENIIEREPEQEDNLKDEEQTQSHQRSVENQNQEIQELSIGQISLEELDKAMIESFEREIPAKNQLEQTFAKGQTTKQSYLHY